MRSATGVPARERWFPVSMGRDRDRKRGLLETYEHTGKRLLVLGVGLLLVLAIAVGASAFATVYAIRHPPTPAILGMIGPASLTGLLFALSSVLKSVARILEVRNSNPALLGETEDEADAQPAADSDRSESEVRAREMITK